MVWKWTDTLTVSLYILGRGCSSDTQERLSVSIKSSVIVLRSIWAVGLPGFWLTFTFVNKCSHLWNHHHFHHPSLSSSSSRNLATCSTPEWKKFVFLFAMGSSSLAGMSSGSVSISPFRFRINFAMRISVWKLIQVSRCETYLFCHIYDIVNYLHWIIIIILVTHLEWDYLSC